MSEEREPVARRLGLTRADGVAYYKRGLKAYEDGDLENAIVDLSEAIYYDRGYAEYYSTRGLFYVENEQVDDARLDLDYALKLNKRQWLAHYALAVLDFRHGDYDSALKHLSEASTIKPDRAEVWFYRAVTEHLLGDDTQAVTDMEKAERLFPPNDKRRKEASAWIKEFKKTVLAPAPRSSAPPLNSANPANRAQLPAPGSSDGPRRLP
ncbi:MAG: tetratricopeptide repeat protein [Chloroflexota bacterium]